MREDQQTRGVGLVSRLPAVRNDGCLVAWPWLAAAAVATAMHADGSETSVNSETVDPVDVLYVDSDPVGVLMVQQSFAQVETPVRLHIARDGGQALRFVRRVGEYRSAPGPRLILLELDLADVPGLGVLAEIKADSDLMTIPVVIFSASQDPLFIRGSYALHANAYVVKPANFDGLAAVIRQLTISFAWLIPPQPGPMPDARVSVAQSRAP